MKHGLKNQEQIINLCVCVTIMNDQSRCKQHVGVMDRMLDHPRLPLTKNSQNSSKMFNYSLLILFMLDGNPAMD